MSVYVDDAKIPFGRMVMSHLFADSEEELHAMADALGLKREWFQPRNGRVSRHYDVSLTKREEALQLGALPLSYPRGVAEWIEARS